jgi:YidC/Oxa1 family membrane protein insertase
MEKRVLLAFILSTLVLAGWYYLSYLFLPPTPDATQPSSPSAISETAAQPVSNTANNEQQLVTSDQRPATSHQRPATSDQPPATSHQRPATSDQLVRVPERLIRVESPFWRVTFSNRGAVPVRWTIIKNKTGPRTMMRGADGGELELIPQSREIQEQLGVPLGLVAADAAITNLLNSTNYAVSESADTIHLEESESRELIFSLQTADVEIQKKFGFHGDRFDFSYSVEARKENQPLPVQTILGPNFGDQSVTQTGSYIAGPHVVADVTGKVERIQAEKPSAQELSGQINWVSVDDNYFALALIPREPITQVPLRSATSTVNVKGAEVPKHFIAAVVPTPNGQVHTIFAGPKDHEVLAAVGKQVGRPSFEHLINYGIGTFIVKPIVDGFLLPVLNFTYRFIPNYGVVILLITFVINMLFFPLKWRGSVKMKQAQALQPKMKELQQKMKNLKKDDPQLKELQMEQVQLMRQANPLGGCLPMLVQLPVFWAFFVLLTVSIDVRQAPFVGWINNLTAPDKVSLLGFELHVLPIAMCLSWMAQTFVMPTPAPASTDPTQAAQQKLQKILMGVVMPVVFTIFFFWKAPSGLVLYWMFNSLVGAGQQVIINRLTHAPEEPKAGSGQAKPGKATAKPAATA